MMQYYIECDGVHYQARCMVCCSVYREEHGAVLYELKQAGKPPVLTFSPEEAQEIIAQRLKDFQEEIH